MTAPDPETGPAETGQGTEGGRPAHNDRCYVYPVTVWIKNRSITQRDRQWCKTEPKNISIKTILK